MKKRILAIDSQILTSVQRCGFKTFLRFLKHLEMNEKPFGMVRGGLGHTLTKTYYTALMEKKDWNDAVGLASEAARLAYPVMNILAEQAEETIKFFYSYAEYYRYDGMEVLGVEEPFTIPIYEDDDLIVVYEGVKDLRCVLPNLGKVVMDHKFRGRMVDYSPLDNQFMGYALAEDVSVVYVDEIGMQKSKEPKERNRRVPLSFTQGMKDRWLKNTIGWSKTLDYYLQNNYWPMQWLQGREGPLCRQCEFHDICDSDNDQEAARKIKMMFHIGDKWEPGKVVKDGE